MHITNQATRTLQAAPVLEALGVQREAAIAMMTRRKFITTTFATGLGATGVLTYLSLNKGSSEYEHAVKQIWRHE